MFKLITKYRLMCPLKSTNKSNNTTPVPAAKFIY